jgi:very-short-patch-repair endonuclease
VAMPAPYMDHREVGLRRLALPRDGVFRRIEAMALGFSDSAIDRRVDAGRLILEARGVLRLAECPPTRRQRAWIVLLAVDGSAVSHRSAAQAHRLDGVEEDIVEMTVPPDCRWEGAAVRTHRSGDLRSKHVQVVDGMPTTTPTRTLVDLGMVCSEEIVLRAVHCALRRRLTTRARLRLMCDELAKCGRAGVPVLRRVLAEVATDPPTESDLESRGAILLQRLGWEEVRRQFEVRRADGGSFRLDFALPDIKLAIELDGSHHRDPNQRVRDRRRDAELERNGWTVVRLEWEDVTTGAADTMRLLAELAASLGRS